MIILLDTSTPTCYLTIVAGDDRFEYEWLAERTLARHLLKFLEEKLQATGGSLKEVSAIGLMKGPGSFTGLRIGASVANALADGLGVPIVGSTGESWREDALSRLKAGENDQVILPDYGQLPNITKPRR